jgi:uncharacterized protein (TIGR03086 family)
MQLDAVVRKAVAETAAVVHGVKPDRLGAPTPCTDWDVRTLGNHLLQVVTALNLAGRGQPVPGELWTSELMTDDWAERFDDEGRAAVDAWDRAAAWDGMVRMARAEMRAPLIATMLASDLTIHGWDLARATHQHYGCDDDVAEATLRFLADTGEQGRQMGIYAPARPVAESAPAFERVLALSGRDPHWAAPAT